MILKYTEICLDSKTVPIVYYNGPGKWKSNMKEYITKAAFIIYTLCAVTSSTYYYIDIPRIGKANKLGPKPFRGA